MAVERTSMIKSGMTRQTVLAVLDVLNPEPIAFEETEPPALDDVDSSKQTGCKRLRMEDQSTEIVRVMSE